MEDEITIGIDFGTTFVCVGAFVNGKVEIISNENDNRLTPCYVAFTEEERLFGETAKHQAALNVENTIYNIKQLMGRISDEPYVRSYGEISSFKVEKDCRNGIVIPVPNKRDGKGNEIALYPEQICAMILAEMKQIAEDCYGKEVKKAVISVPACFSNLQRQAALNAGKIAGLDVIGLINQPTAAALAYTFDKRDNKKKTVAVFDFGGGSLDLTLARINEKKIEVIYTCGERDLGGDDIDKVMVEYFRKNLRIDIQDQKNRMRLTTACEKLKRSLSGSSRARTQLEQASDYEPLQLSLTREKFNELNKGLYERIRKILEDSLQSPEFHRGTIDEIVLVGGSSRIPAVRDLLKETFKVYDLNKTVNPDEAVAYGASLYSAILSNRTEVAEYLLYDVVSHPIFIDGQEVVSKCGKIPIKTQMQRTREAAKLQVYEKLSVRSNPLLVCEYTLQSSQFGKGYKVHIKIDDNGIIQIIPEGVQYKSCGMHFTDEVISKMISQNEDFSENDSRIIELSRAKNDLEKYVYHQKQVAQNADIPSENKREILNKCDEMIKWMVEYEDDKPEKLRANKDALEKFINSKMRPQNTADFEEVEQIVGEEGSEVIIEGPNTLNGMFTVKKTVLNNVGRTRVLQYIEGIVSKIQLFPSEDRKLMELKCNELKQMVAKKRLCDLQAVDAEIAKISTMFKTKMQPVVPKRQKEDEEAKQSLLQCKNGIMHFMNKFDGNFGNMEKKEIFKKCDEIDTLAKNDKIQTVREFNQKKSELTELCDRMIDEIQKGVKDKEKARAKLRNLLKKFMDEGKSRQKSGSSKVAKGNGAFKMEETPM